MQVRRTAGQLVLMGVLALTALLMLMTLLARSWFTAGAQTNPYKALQNFEEATPGQAPSGAMISYLADGLTATAVAAPTGDGAVGIKLASDNNSWRNLVVPFAAGSITADASALVFYVKNGASVTNATTTLEHSAAGYAPSGNPGAALLAADGQQWTAATYWDGWGVDIPANFEGYVKIPLGSLGFAWPESHDGLSIDLTAVTQLNIYFNGFTGDLHVDSFYVIGGPDDGAINVRDQMEDKDDTGTTAETAPTVKPPTEPPATPASFRIIQNFEKYTAGQAPTGAVSYMAEGLAGETVSSPTGDGTAALKVTATNNSWRDMVLPLGGGVSLRDATALLYYVKVDGNAAANMTFKFEYANGGYSYKTGAEIGLLAKNAGAWTAGAYSAGSGVTLEAGFEGYIKLPFEKLAVDWGGDTAVDLAKVTQITMTLNGFAGALYLDSFYAVVGPDDGGVDIRQRMEATEEEKPTTTTRSPDEPKMDTLLDFEGFEPGDDMKRGADNPTGVIEFPNKAVALDIHASVSDNRVADGSNSLYITSDIRQDWAQGLLYLPGSRPLEGYEAMIFYVKAPDTGFVEEFSFTMAMQMAGGGDYRLGNCDIKVLRRGSTVWTNEKYLISYGAALGMGFEGYVKVYFKDFEPNAGTDHPAQMDPASVLFINFWFHNFGGPADGDKDAGFYLDAFYGVAEDSDDTGFVPVDWNASAPTTPTNGWQGDPTEEEPGGTTTVSGGEDDPPISPDTMAGFSCALAAAALLAAMGLLLALRRRHFKE